MRWFCKCVETWGPAQLDEIICMLDCWISVNSDSARTDGGDGEMEGRARSVWSAGWQDGHMLSASSLPACLPAACPSTWLLHQYNNELDIEGLLSAGESWPLMPRFGHLYPATLPLVPPPHSLDCSSEVQWNYCGLWRAHYIVISSRTNSLDCILLMRWDGWLFGLAELQSCTWSSLSSHQSAIILACLGWTVWKQSNSLNQSRASKQSFY